MTLWKLLLTAVICVVAGIALRSSIINAIQARERLIVEVIKVFCHLTDLDGLQIKILKEIKAGAWRLSDLIGFYPNATEQEVKNAVIILKNFEVVWEEESGILRVDISNVSEFVQRKMRLQQNIKTRSE